MSDKSRVCFVSESSALYDLVAGKQSMRVGGAEVQQVLVAKVLASQGHPIVFVAPCNAGPHKTELYNGISFIGLQPRKSSLKGASMLKWIYAYYLAMKQADAQVYYQRTRGAGTALVSVLARLMRRKFVYAVASNLDVDFSKDDFVKPRDIRLYRYGLRRADAVITQTEDQLRLLKQNTGRDGVLIRSVFSPPEDDCSTDERQHILWVGNYRKVKRPEMFIELAVRLPQHKFVMVGGSGEADGIGFEEIRGKASAVRNLDLTGFVPFEQVGEYFRRAKVLVNTSAAEGFPNTYLQAWCRGVPVAGTFDADNLLSKMGLGFHCSDIDELVKATDLLATDSELNGEIGEKARQYVFDNHSPNIIGEKYSRLFTAICSSPKAD